MKKKIFVIMICCMMAMAFAAGCGKKVCDFCGEKKLCQKKDFFGEEIYICNDCLNEWQGY